MNKTKVKLIDKTYISEKYGQDKDGYTKVRIDRAINDFIKDKKVIDIKYQTNMTSIVWDGVDDDRYLVTALVIYEVDGEEESVTEA